MKVPVFGKTLTTCKCKSCPTLMQQFLSGALFCSVSAREKVSERHGCNCPGCQVHYDYALSGEYFCIQSVTNDA